MNVDKICQLRPTELFNPENLGLVSPARGWGWGIGSWLAPSCCLFIDLHEELFGPGLSLTNLDLGNSFRANVGLQLPQGFRSLRAVGIPTFLLRQIWDQSQTP